MALLWANVGKYPDIDLILIQCYSGWRPRELCYLRLDDVDLNARTFTDGLKQMRERTASCRFIPASSIWSKPAIRNPSNLEAPICVLISQKVKCAKFATRDTGCTIKISLLHSISILSISPTMAGSTSSPWLKNTTWMNTPSSESSVIISKT